MSILEKNALAIRIAQSEGCDQILPRHWQQAEALLNESPNIKAKIKIQNCSKQLPKRKSAKRRFTPNKFSPEKCRKIFELREQGLTLRAIAKEFNCCHRTIQRVLCGAGNYGKQ